MGDKTTKFISTLQKSDNAYVDYTDASLEPQNSPAIGCEFKCTWERQRYRKW